MTDQRRARFTAVTVRGVVLAGSAVVAQSALAVLGLTETAARGFVMNEISAPSSHPFGDCHRRHPRVAQTSAGRPRAAATGLVAWAKAYANSPAFTDSYTSFQQGRIAPSRKYPLTVEQQVRKDLDEQLAGFEQLRQAAEKMAPAQRDAMLEQVKTARANLTDPAYIKKMEAIVAAEREQENGTSTNANIKDEETWPADTNMLVARRLKEFLSATTDVNFSARTINLTGGFDGIEFVDKADRAKHWLWQQAAIVGLEATAAARAAAGAWLKEIAR